MPKEKNTPQEKETEPVAQEQERAAQPVAQEQTQAAQQAAKIENIEAESRLKQLSNKVVEFEETRAERIKRNFQKLSDRMNAESKARADAGKKDVAD